MIESQILQAIAERVEDERLHFQIVVSERELYVYINRDTEDYLDYVELTSTIRTAIADLKELNLLTMELYSRALGEIEPDWQTSVKLAEDNSASASIELMVEDIDRAVADAESLTTRLKQDSQPLIESADNSKQNTFQSIKSSSADEAAPSADMSAEDFSQYCFIRNQRLLNADLVAPGSAIAQLVKTFHQFEIDTKRSHLSKLENYFKYCQIPDLTSLEPKIQTWWTETMALNSNAKRKLAIWLSRYCFDPETTMAKIEGTLVTHTEVQKVSPEKARQQAKEAREARNNAYLDRLNTVAESARSMSQSSKSTSDHWISGILTVFTIKLIAGITWHYSDLTFSNGTVELNPVPKVVQSSEQNSRRQVTEARQFFNLGKQKYDRGDFNSALADLTDAIEIHPRDPSYGDVLEKSYNLRGLVLQNLDDYYPAVEDANRAIAIAPATSDYYASRGLAYLGMRDYSAAIADQTKAIQLKPKYSYWYFYRGKTYYEAGDYERALADLDLAIALNSFTIEACEQRYYTHRALGNLERAKFDYEKAKYFGMEPQN